MKEKDGANGDRTREEERVRESKRSPKRGSREREESKGVKEEKREEDGRMMG